MKRALIACVAACGAPHVERAPTEPVVVAVAVDAGTDAVKIVDTSIAAIWASPPQREAKPPPPPRIEEDVVARPMPRARRPGRRAPCFANRDVLIGRDEVWQDLNRFAIRMDQDHPPSGRYGSCTITDGELRDARKRLVAAVGCGLTMYVPGIVDELGFELGASGADVEAARPDDSIRCAKGLENRTTCVFHRPSRSGDDPGTYYVFDGVPAIADDAVLIDADARAFIRNHAVVEMTLRITCH